MFKLPFQKVIQIYTVIKKIKWLSFCVTVATKFVLESKVFYLKLFIS